MSVPSSFHKIQECLVRYENFGTAEDEWVVVKEAVRRRSIPIDPDECYRVAVGDHVICFHVGLFKTQNCSILFLLLYRLDFILKLKMFNFIFFLNKKGQLQPCIIYNSESGANKQVNIHSYLKTIRYIIF